MPVIRSCTRQNIDTIHVQSFSNVLEYLGCLALHLCDLVCTLSPDLFVDVHDGANNSSWIFIESPDVFTAATVDTCNTDSQLFIGALR